MHKYGTLDKAWLYKLFVQLHPRKRRMGSYWPYSNKCIAMKSRETWSKSGFLNFEGLMKTRYHLKVFHFSLQKESLLNWRWFKKKEKGPLRISIEIQSGQNGADPVPLYCHWIFPNLCCQVVAPCHIAPGEPFTQMPLGLGHVAAGANQIQRAWHEFFVSFMEKSGGRWERETQNKFLKTNKDTARPKRQSIVYFMFVPSAIKKYTVKSVSLFSLVLLLVRLLKNLMENKIQKNPFSSPESTHWQSWVLIKTNEHIPNGRRVFLLYFQWISRNQNSHKMSFLCCLIISLTLKRI